MLLFLCAFAAAIDSQSLSPPPADLLKHVAQARESLRTGYVEWVVEDVEKHRRSHFTGRFAGATVIDTLNKRERPPSPPGTVPFDGLSERLSSPNGIFYHDEGRIVEFYPEGGRSAPLDPRALGLAPMLAHADPHAVLLEEQGPTRTYDVRTEDGLTVVTWDDGEYSQSYWLDGRRNYMPVRVTRARLGELVSESRIQLDQFGDTWFPREIEVWLHVGHSRLTQRILVRKAEFNQPGHARTLTPADIGISDGAPVLIYDGSGREREMGIWTGVEVVGGSEYRDKLEALRRLQPTIPVGKEQEALKRWLDRNDRDLSEWELYTRSFIARFNLDDEQTAKALTILQDCRQQADVVVARTEKEYERLQADFKASMGEAGQPRTKPILQRINAIRDSPLREIFAKQLVPRLDQLPTRSQRRAAETDLTEERATPATQPVSDSD